jgi:yeast amino acid transporter
MTWFGICFTYIQFYKGLKVQGIDRSSLPYASKLNPYAAWYALVWIIVICFFSGFSVFLPGNWSTATFVTNYLPFILFPILYSTMRIVTRIPMIKPGDMDFKSGLAEIEAATYDEPPPRNAMERFFQWL